MADLLNRIGTIREREREPSNKAIKGKVDIKSVQQKSFLKI